MRDALAIDLLKALFAGYPVANLIALLRSPEPRQVRTGVWVLSELGARGRELSGELPRLMRSDDHQIRFFAIDSALSCSTANEGRTVGAAIKLVDDPHQGVRFKATDLLTRCHMEVLEAGVEALGMAEPDAPYTLGGRWLISGNSRDPLHVEQVLRNGPATWRKFAFAAAVRNFQSDTRLLEAAFASGDPDITELSRRELARAK